MRRPLEQELIRRGLAVDRTESLRLIDSGRVLVAGAPARNPRRQVDASESLSVSAETGRFVSRGGEKLWGAMEQLGVRLDGARVLDAGASTGGFTDVVLQRGAASVVAVDVGRGQLHERLRQDPRVTVMDRVNLRVVDPARLGSFDWVVGDLSFISLDAVLDTLLAVSEPGARLLVLVKPQFEAAHDTVSATRGVISDPAEWRAALRRTVDAAVARGANVVDAVVSPIRGAQGNVEFFLYMTKPATSDPTGAEPADAVTEPDPTRLEQVRAGTESDEARPTHDIIDRAVSNAVRLFAGSPQTEENTDIWLRSD